MLSCVKQVTGWVGLDRRWRVLVVTSVVAFMATLDVTIVNIAFPEIRRSFPAASLGDLSWILNAYNVVFAAALVPAGRLADRLGRKRLFLVGVVVFVAASALCGVAGAVGVLVGARIVQALAGAVLVPTSLSLALPEFPITQRATATALWTSTGAVAAAAGPSLGGFLTHWLGWPAVFFVNLVIGLPMLIPARRLLRESRDDSGGRWPDFLGAALLAGAVAAVALAMVQGPDWGWGSAGVLGALGAAVVLFVGFVASSVRHPAPVVDFALLRIRSFTVAGVGSFVFAIGFFGLLLGNVLFLTGVWQFSVLTAGAAVTPGPIVAALSAPVAGRLADRFGQRAIAVPGTVLFGLGVLVLALATTATPHYVGTFLPAALLTGAGVGLTLPAFGSAGVAELPRTRFATGIGVTSSLRQIGAVVGIASVIVVVGGNSGGVLDLDSFHRAWLLIAGTSLLALLAGIGLGRIRPGVRPAAVPASGSPVDLAHDALRSVPSSTQGESR